MPSKSVKTTKPKRVALPPRRAPKTREAALARAAHEYALSKTGRSYGAPVSEQQIRYYEAALKQLRKSKTIAQFLSFKSNDAALRALRPVATGTASSASLPAATKDAFAKLFIKLNSLHAASGQVNKTWPRKHAIVIVALLSEKPARKSTPKKPKTVAAAPVVDSSTETPATA